MEVILRETIPNLGRVGEIVKVKDGYGRNYLIPQGKAYLATKGNKRRVDAESEHRAVRAAAEQSDAEVVAAKLDSLELHFTARAGEGDKLFGSITSADIAGQLGDLGYQVDKRAVELEEPIRMIGIYKVPVRLHPEARAEVRVWVVRE